MNEMMEFSMTIESLEARINEILGLSHGAASNLLRTMKENGLLESIKGRGKGKYRFTSQYWRES